MRLTNAVVKQYIGGELDLIELFAPEVPNWARATVTSVRVTGRRREDRRLKLTMDSLKVMIDFDKWESIEPRSIILPLDDVYAQFDGAGRLVLDTEDGLVLSFTAPGEPQRENYPFIVPGEDEEGQPCSFLCEIACTENGFKLVSQEQDGTVLEVYQPTNTEG